MKKILIITLCIFTFLFLLRYFVSSSPERRSSNPVVETSNPESSSYPHTFKLSNRITQHPHYFYPVSKFTYDATNEEGIEVILETKEKVKCNKIKTQGYYTQVIMGDGTGSTRQNYTGTHYFSEYFVCSN